MNRKRFWGMIACLLCALMLAGCDDVGPQEAESEEELVLVESVLLADGTQVDRWRQPDGWEDYWRLPDQTALLFVSVTPGPENVFVGGLESLNDLSEPAQKAIVDYYTQQGLLYDIQAELEKAYAEYQSCQSDGKTYNERWIQQYVAPSAFSSQIACFLTSVMLPLDDSMCREEQLGAVFDRETGEWINNWDLFTVPPEDALTRILDASDIRDTELRAAMQAAVQPEYIVLFPEHIQILFPQGSLPGQDFDYHIAADYSDIKAILQPWAIPNGLA